MARISETIWARSFLHGKILICKFIFISRYMAIYFIYFFLNMFFKDFIYLFLERWGGREKEREHQCVVASHLSPTADLASNPDMCPDWELDWWPFGSQAGTQYWATLARALSTFLCFCLSRNLPIVFNY